MLIIFDFDDTLVKSGIPFDRIRREVANSDERKMAAIDELDRLLDNLMGSKFSHPEERFRKTLEIATALTGYDRFTVDELVKMAFYPEKLEHIISYSTLESIAEKHNVAVVTIGDASYQLRKWEMYTGKTAEEFNQEGKFMFISVSTAAAKVMTISQLILTLGDDGVWLIGNDFERDILNPYLLAIENGYKERVNAILVDAPWYYRNQRSRQLASSPYRSLFHVLLYVPADETLENIIRALFLGVKDDEE